jgi:hypothetical protein
MVSTEEVSLQRAAECLELASLVSDESAGLLLTRMAEVWVGIAKRSGAVEIAKSE